MEGLFETIEKLDIFPGGLGKDGKAGMEEKFRTYMDGVLRWNEKVNLTAITDRDEFIKKHFIDSVMCAGSPEIRGAEKIADIGTGAGFPGVPLAILFPEKEFCFIDSLAKRLRIVDELCKEAGIENVITVPGRAEDLASKNGECREIFDCVLSRAVASMASLAELCIPFLRTGGTFIAYKGSEFEKETEEGSVAIKEMGGEVIRTERCSDPDGSFDHGLIYIRKERKTPDKYPRKAGDPVRKPIK
ncbi:MAG: 16S rRNA (guanine(527)-N(7))-methyltransferase RsmG [Firmicutes bacterium]|nr:16S rRNA (guanine(527)-N(7))-methyltransferase RsmG [Bacillota bacterium]